jgi:hypothetical protein
MDKRYSTNHEDFIHHDVDEVFDDLDSDGRMVVDQVYYEADFRNLLPADFTDKRRLEMILERFDDELYEDVGEISDNDFYNVTDDAKDELRNLLNTWIEKHVNVSKYWTIVGKSRKCVVTAEDVAERIK